MAQKKVTVSLPIQSLQNSTSLNYWNYHPQPKEILGIQKETGLGAQGAVGAVGAVG